MSEDTKNEVAVFEEIRRDLAVNQQLKVPMSYVFGRGTVGNIESFGGRSLAENALKVDQAMVVCSELQNIWNHSHTQWSWKHINMDNVSPFDNMRQIAAELAGKKNALNEAKWRHVETELKLKKLEDELKRGKETCTLDYWREVEINIKIAKMKEGLVEGMTYIEGAMKDVLALNEIYEQLTKQLSNFSEADLEKAESKNHLRRALAQSIRDVRMTGSITKGEQELMEQIGVNPMKLQRILRAYVAQEEKQETWGIDGLYEFINKLADELIDEHKVDVIRMNLQGFTQESPEQYSYINKVARLENKSGEN